MRDDDFWYNITLMKKLNKKEPFVLFWGDIAVFLLSLWLTLFVRYGKVPTGDLFLGHAVPFSFLFVVFVIIFFIDGLYERRNAILSGTIIPSVLNAQFVNSAIAVLFFYLIPFFGITPKTNLFIFLVISTVAIALWRHLVRNLFTSEKRERGMIIGTGKETEELFSEINGNARHNLEFVSWIDPEKKTELDFRTIAEEIKNKNIVFLAIDLQNKKIEPLLPEIYRLIFSHVHFAELSDLYEAVFERVPLSLVRHAWFLEHVSLRPTFAYDVLKRLMDIVLSFILAVISLIVYPFVFLAIKADDGGALWSFQDRIGQNGKIIRLFKFRTMSKANDRGLWGGTNVNIVTRVGKFLRKSRIDELPQLWNVLRGDLSLIGPRPEFPAPVEAYSAAIPYYGVRHLVKPGLSGWAQIYHQNHPHHSTDVIETRNKLSYDLYYVKNRSFLLDLKIALRTLQILVSQKGK